MTTGQWCAMTSWGIDPKGHYPINKREQIASQQANKQQKIVQYLPIGG